MKLSTLVLGIECSAEAAGGAPLRGVISSHVLEEVLDAAPSGAGWLQAACAHSEAVRLAIRREAARMQRSTVVVSANALRQSLQAVKPTASRSRGQPLA